jgi:beta-1,2-mannobiose phosphorylase / 1,2-beta-oligomannan phosphorylase
VIQVDKLGILLHKTKHQFECEGVLNPAVIAVGDKIHLFYRALAKDNYSTIGYCRLSAPMTIEHRNEKPLLVPQAEYEYQGLEDPRIVVVDGEYLLSYTAFDGINALGALATSSDLINWEKHGIIVPKITYQKFQHFTDLDQDEENKYKRFNKQNASYDKHERDVFLWDKNLVFFPRKINNKLCFLHRIKPDIQIVVEVEKIEDLTVEFWQNYFLSFDEHVVLTPKYDHEVSYIGGGCPPIETSAGWLVIYHSVHDTIKGYVYSACAALLDLNNPNKEIARLPYPLFFPDQEWELIGEVNNVCFPTGAVVDNDTLYIYYGAADKRIAVASMSISTLINELLLNKT